MSRSREPIRLEGFNNLTKIVSFNLYDFAVARTQSERDSYIGYLHEHFSGPRITAILSEIARIIDAEVLSVSAQDYDPYGASSLVLMSDLGHGQVVGADGKVAGGDKIAASVGAHLTKSHLCAHTYPDVQDPRGICTFRVDIDVATCGTIVPLRALDYMFESFENDVVIIDYVVRGFTRDIEGNRIYMDHTVRSIQDFIDPKVLANYECEDLALPGQNIWQTKMKRTELDPAQYFAPGVDPSTDESRELLGLIKREMAGIYYSLPN
jgi:S-adenosylmethionine decarboxylase